MVLGPAVTATIFVRTGQPYQSWLIALAILLGILGQAGDLYMSSLKRAFGIKDFAKKSLAYYQVWVASAIASILSC